jgi:hypothetical protein
VTHPRDLADADFVRKLAGAGVEELVPMIYGAGEERTAAMVEGVLAANPHVGVTLAQSIEPGVAAAPGRTEALARWQRLASELSGFRNFRGVAVQSLEDFTRAPP